MSHVQFILLVFIIVTPGFALAIAEIRSLQQQVALLHEALKALTRKTVSESSNPGHSANTVDLTAAKTATKARKPRVIRGAR
jgi:predicted Holliday junction resolvase-like endonuclease